jgi:hypothetical protein
VCSRDAAETSHGASIKNRAKSVYSQRSLRTIKDRKWEKKESKGLETVMRKVAGARMKSRPKMQDKRGRGRYERRGDRDNESDVDRRHGQRFHRRRVSSEKQKVEKVHARDKKKFGKHTIF